jgi:5-methyltetrahydropteroyltriglutamate--homocysteine methyltransferase
MQSAKKISQQIPHSTPPFKADQVGSLLRPAYLLRARDEYATGKINAGQLRETENKAIQEIVRKQEELGFESITDGELRRAYFHLDFMSKLDGVNITGNIAANSDAQEKVDWTPPKLSITGKLKHSQPIQLDDFNVLQSFTRHTPKVSIPSPTMAHFRGGRDAIDREVYPDLDEFFSDLAQCYRDEIESLYQAGCRYIQLDDTNLAYLCDEKMREDACKRGDDPDKLPLIYAKLINEAIANDHDDLSFGIHLCRGNHRSNWFAEGGYGPVAEVLFNELNIGAYFLEFDDERSGSFEPLRFVPEDKQVVLVLICSKVPELEDKKEVHARIEEAARIVPLENLCLSPQCGFSSTHHGNDLTEQQQWDKLALVKEIADEVWQG